VDLVSSVPSRVPLGPPTKSEMFRLLEKDFIAKKEAAEILAKKRGKKNRRNNKKKRESLFPDWGKKKLGNCKFDNVIETVENFIHDIDNETIIEMKSAIEIDRKKMNIGDDQVEGGEKIVAEKVDERHQVDGDTEYHVNSLKRAQIVQMYLSTARPPCKKCVRAESRLGVGSVRVIPKNDIEIEIHRNRGNEVQVRTSGSGIGSGSSSGSNCCVPFTDGERNTDDGKMLPDSTKSDQNVSCSARNVHRTTRNVLYGLQRCREVLLRKAGLLPRYPLSPPSFRHLNRISLLSRCIRRQKENPCCLRINDAS
jgi:hypothetical protein